LNELVVEIQRLKTLLVNKGTNFSTAL